MRSDNFKWIDITSGMVIPPLRGLFSAFGMTVADQQYDYQRPVERDLDDAGLFSQFAEPLNLA